MSHDGHFVHIVLVLAASACLLALLAPAGHQEQRRRALRRAAGSGRLVSDAERRARAVLSVRPEPPRTLVTAALAGTVTAAGLHAVVVPQLFGSGAALGTVLAALAAGQLLCAVATVRCVGRPRLVVPVLVGLAAVDGAGVVGDAGGGLHTGAALAATGALWADLPWVAEGAATVAAAVATVAVVAVARRGVRLQAAQ